MFSSHQIWNAMFFLFLGDLINFQRKPKSVCESQVHIYLLWADQCDQTKSNCLVRSNYEVKILNYGNIVVENVFERI